MHKDLKFRPAKEALDKPWLAPRPFHSVAQFTPELRALEPTDLASFNSFEGLPEPRIGIQLWGIGRQALQVEAVRRTIRDNDHPAWDLAQ